MNLMNDAGKKKKKGGKIDAKQKRWYRKGAEDIGRTEIE